MTSLRHALTGVFDKALASCGLGAEKSVALAVSGGGDSMALAVLAAQVLLPRGVRLKAYTVDHGLRAESAQEAAQTGAAVRALGIEHGILCWQGEKPETHVQERARQARYQLLSDACRRDGFGVLLTAHQAEDQIETFWMRLAHGSGLDGLGVMAPRRVLSGGLVLARPLLGVAREDLRDLCRAAGVSWAEDPSNRSPKYLRARLRGFEEMLAAEGLSPQRLMQVLQKLEDARAALDMLAAEKFAAAAAVHPEGYAVLDISAFACWPEDIARRVLSRVLRMVAPSDYPPGFDLLRALCADLRGGAFAGRTAYGCDLSPLGVSGQVLVAREYAAVAPPVPLRQADGDCLLWDGRFVLSGLHAGVFGESSTLGPLGSQGVEALRKQAAGDKNILAALERLPGKVRVSLPAIWRGEKLLSVPHLSWQDAAAAGEGAAVQVAFSHRPEGYAPMDDCFAGI